jgi:uncharacterized phage infection (PIP) family protein YhgE
MTSNKTGNEGTATVEEFDDISYEELIQLTLRDFEKLEQTKKSRIRSLALKLEKLGTPKNMISQKISRDLHGRVNSSYVRLCLTEEYKNSKQIRKQITSKSRELKHADDGRKALVTITNEGIHETIELDAEEREPSRKVESDIIESLQIRIRTLQRQNEDLTKKLAEKSPQFHELYKEIEQLKQIESERIEQKDFTTAESLLSDNRELLQKIQILEEQLNQQQRLLAKYRFEAFLELKGQLIPVAILIDRFGETAKVMVDATN